MTHKEKAVKLVNTFAGKVGEFDKAKECAKLCVEEIIEGIEEVDEFSRQNLDRTLAWWESVKTAIENLTAHPGA